MTVTIGREPHKKRVPKECATCLRGWENPDNPPFVSCGCAVEKNPIWAERKYSELAVLFTLAGAPPKNSDCDNMQPRDGKLCKAYEGFGE